MKQVLQNLRTGKTEIAEVPSPRAAPGQLLIRSSCSLVSAGTERMLVDFGRAGWLQKARQQPDKVRAVVEKIRTDGLGPTIQSVTSKLDKPMAMGYCNVGRVIDVGEGVTGFTVGDRVVSNGPHAEIVSVPMNLCAKVPAGVSDEQAVFTVMGAIGLQGIRLANPTLGECVVVIGLGLIGLITVQLLKGQGCRVLGADFDSSRVQLARDFGAEAVDLGAGQDLIASASLFSRERGVDAVLITAATSSNDPVHQAAIISRKRGRIVLVGVAGLELSRADFYEKELTFQVSCSYGPGRYDANYEEKGRDYPIGFVRWTEQRNFEAVLDMMSERRVDCTKLVSHTFDIARADQAYDTLVRGESALGILVAYPHADSSNEENADRVVAVMNDSRAVRREAKGSVSFIGAGNYANVILVPAFKSASAELHTVVSAAGVSGLHAARKFGFAQASTDPRATLEDPRTDAIVIATRHDSHAKYVIAAHAAGKHVFVEKPLCITLDELEAIQQRYLANSEYLLMVGFNRRFAPQVLQMKRLLSTVSGPSAFVVTVNAGAIPATHWAQDPATGGGRIVGECCHFVDLLRFLADVPIESYSIVQMSAVTRDTVTISLRFSNGSIGTIHYFSNGNKQVPKERVEVFSNGRVLLLDNFRRLTGYGWSNFKAMKLWHQDKGQDACARAFMDAVRNRASSPIPLEQIFEVSRISIELQSALQ